MMQRQIRYHRRVEESGSWIRYPSPLKRQSPRSLGLRRLLKFGVLPMVLIGLFFRTTGGDAQSPKRSAPGPGSKISAGIPKTRTIRKSDVQDLLNGKRLMNLAQKSFDVTSGGHQYHVDTSLDMSLQAYLQTTLKRSTSRYIGIVVMEPESGRILSMVGYDKTDPKNNPCLDNRFPAASIFKIVTAAAAVETNGLESGSQFTYNGNKYTLYRSQIRERKTRYTRKINLRDSFAQSINPVFGKIGANDLGKTTLEKYAESFGFNRQIGFELPLPPSFIMVSDEPYHWAEIASGFNRETTLSAVHGALLAAAVANRGSLLEPFIIEKIVDEAGQTVYTGQQEVLNQAITPEASEVMHRLMCATVRSGTSKKAFRGYRGDRVLSRLIIGGKTGSINNRARDTRFDWFVGFAEEKEGPKKLAVSVVVGHEKHIGTRASRYARMAIQHYFRDYFSKQVVTSEKDSNRS